MSHSSFSLQSTQKLMYDHLDQNTKNEQIQVESFGITLQSVQRLILSKNQQKIRAGFVQLLGIYIYHPFTRENLSDSIYKEMFTICNSFPDFLVSKALFEFTEEACKQDKSFVHALWSHDFHFSLLNCLQNINDIIVLNPLLNTIFEFVSWTTSSFQFFFENNFLESILSLLQKFQNEQAAIVKILKIIYSMTQLTFSILENYPQFPKLIQQLIPLLDNPNDLISTQAIYSVAGALQHIDPQIIPYESLEILSPAQSLLQIMEGSHINSFYEAAGQFFVNLVYSDSIAVELVKSGLFSILGKQIILNSKNVIPQFAKDFIRAARNGILSSSECEEAALSSQNEILEAAFIILKNGDLLDRYESLDLFVTLIDQPPSLSKILHSFEDLPEVVTDLLCSLSFDLNEGNAIESVLKCLYTIARMSPDTIRNSLNNSDALDQINDIISSPKLESLPNKAEIIRMAEFLIQL